ncbi:ead/Ea22-like family protein [Klebsiella variicola]
MTDITELAQRMKAAAEKATPGEWWADEVKNEGCYGSGDDCVEGFTSYAIYGSDGQTLFDSLNSDAACISEEYDGEGHVAWDETAQRNAEFIALANPANVLALVEALEKAQGMEAYWKTQCRGITDHCEELQARIAELESHTVKPPVHPTVASENLDDETLQELIEFRRTTFEYHSKEGNKVQTIIHGVTLAALRELQERRKADSEPVATLDVQSGRPVPVVSADLLHSAASAIEDLLTTKDRTGAGVWFDLPFRLRSAANAQPASVVPDELPVHAIAPYSGAEYEAGYRDGWNACRAAMLQAEPVCSCPSGNGSLRWPCPVHPGNSPAIPDSARDALEKALAAMEFMGDTLNNLDAVCTEDVELVAPAFDAIRNVLAAAPQEVKDE